jgi:hypothetical protein
MRPLRGVMAGVTVFRRLSRLMGVSPALFEPAPAIIIVVLARGFQR